MVLRNQQTGAAFDSTVKKEIMGVQITLIPLIRDMTSMLDTIKTRVWKTPEMIDAMRFYRMASIVFDTLGGDTRI